MKIDDILTLTNAVYAGDHTGWPFLQPPGTQAVVISLVRTSHCDICNYSKKSGHSGCSVIIDGKYTTSLCCYQYRYNGGE